MEPYFHPDSYAYRPNKSAIGAKLNTDYILGMAKMEGNVRILLDINRVLSGEEIAALEKAA